MQWTTTIVEGSQVFALLSASNQGLLKSLKRDYYWELPRLKNMRTKKLTVILFCAASALVAKERNWQIGKVLDSESARTYIPTGASTSATTAGTVSPDYGSGSTVHANTSAQTQIHQMAIQDTELLIVGTEFAYIVDDRVAKSVGVPSHGVVSRAIMNRKHGCRFVMSDEIKYSQEKAKLYVIDADGKECKLDILRQERLRK